MDLRAPDDQNESTRKRRLAVLVGPPLLLAVVVASAVVSLALAAVLALVLLLAAGVVILGLLKKGYDGERGRVPPSPSAEPPPGLSLKEAGRSNVGQAHPPSKSFYFFAARAPHRVREGKQLDNSQRIQRAGESLEETRRRLPPSRGTS